MALQNYVRTITGYVAKVLTPDNVLALARGEGGLSQGELLQSTHIIKEFVRPGDLILTRTPSAVFGILRDIGQTDYDHVLAVIDKERSLHISYPHAQLVPTTQFVQRKKQPVILRPKFSVAPGSSESQRASQFTTMLKHSLVGKPYDYARVLQYVMASRLAHFAPTLYLNKYLNHQ